MGACDRSTALRASHMAVAACLVPQNPSGKAAIVTRLGNRPGERAALQIRRMDGTLTPPWGVDNPSIIHGLLSCPLPFHPGGMAKRSRWSGIARTTGSCGFYPASWRDARLVTMRVRHIYSLVPHPPRSLRLRYHAETRRTWRLEAEWLRLGGPMELKIITAYLDFLALDRQVSAATQKQALNTNHHDLPSPHETSRS